jgi:hypothetical protein
MDRNETASGPQTLTQLLKCRIRPFLDKAVQLQHLIFSECRGIMAARQWSSQTTLAVAL